MIKVEEKLIPVNKRFSKEYHLKDALNELNNPQQDIPTINIVGTNGKGSTSYYLSLGLKQKYKKVGLFISPAFMFQNERIQINNEFISDEDLKKYLKSIEPLISKYNLTFFEIWTLIMILYFKDQKVDIAVVEAGIGGMKDSTNVLSNQLATLFSAVGLDHVDVLGNTIEQIIYQKVNIAKPNTTIYVSDDNKKYDLIIKKSLKNKNVKIVYGSRIKDDIYYQTSNKGLVKTYLKTLGITNYDFLNSNPPLGRFTVLSNQPLFVIDGAHNQNGIDEFVESYKKRYPNKQPTVLMASSYNKDYMNNIKKLSSVFGDENVYITNFDHFKSWNINSIDYDNKVLDWEKFLNEKLKENKDIIVCGSLYFAPMVYKWFINNFSK